MAARPRLGLLAAAVVAAHLAALDWFARELDHGSILQAAAQPMFTRLLQPEAAPPPAPAPRAAAKPKPAPPAENSIAASLPRPEPAASTPEAVTTTVAPQEPPQALAPPPVRTASAQTAAAAAEPPGQAASSPTASLASWPTDTRVNYRVGGMYRGELYGDARVQWNRQGDQYQVRLDVDITLFGTLLMTSQGDVTEEGLMPRAYEEERRGKRRAARFGERAIELENGKSALKPAGVQDTASQFVELTYRFASGREALEVGRSVSFWMARPGAVDLWTYDIVERVTLDTPELGKIDAFHLKPRPIANPRGNITMEMWFAPSLQYLPVRIQVKMGDEAYVDLMVEKIEQR